MSLSSGASNVNRSSGEFNVWKFENTETTPPRVHQNPEVKEKEKLTEKTAKESFRSRETSSKLSNQDVKLVRPEKLTRRQERTKSTFFNISTIAEPASTQSTQNIRDVKHHEEVIETPSPEKPKPAKISFTVLSEDNIAEKPKKVAPRREGPVRSKSTLDLAKAGMRRVETIGVSSEKLNRALFVEPKVFKERQELIEKISKSIGKKVADIKDPDARNAKVEKLVKRSDGKIDDFVQSSTKKKNKAEREYDAEILRFMPAKRTAYDVEAKTKEIKEEVGHFSSVFLNKDEIKKEIKAHVNSQGKVENDLLSFLTAQSKNKSGDEGYCTDKISKALSQIG